MHGICISFTPNLVQHVVPLAEGGRSFLTPPVAVDRPWTLLTCFVMGLHRFVFHFGPLFDDPYSRFTPKKIMLFMILLLSFTWVCVICIFYYVLIRLLLYGIDLCSTLAPFPMTLTVEIHTWGLGLPTPVRCHAAGVLVTCFRSNFLSCKPSQF